MSEKYQIAIPSYRRPQSVVSQTLRTLVRHGSKLTNVTVFVANQEEKREYDMHVQSMYGSRVPVVVGVPGLLEQRRFYSSSYYSCGTPILNIDDDVSGLFEKTDDGKTKPLNAGVDDLAIAGFELCEKHGSKLWGINAVLNGFFMRDTVTVGLRYICGIFHGTFAGDPLLCGDDRFPGSSGEDFETTLAHYKKHGSVIRFDGVAPKTKYFAPGGMQAELGNNKESRQRDHSKRLAMIAERYPDLCSLVEKAGGVHNIRCKTMQSISIECRWMGAGASPKLTYVTA